MALFYKDSFKSNLLLVMLIFWITQVIFSFTWTLRKSFYTPNGKSIYGLWFDYYNFSISSYGIPSLFVFSLPISNCCGLSNNDANKFIFRYRLYYTTCLKIVQLDIIFDLEKISSSHHTFLLLFKNVLEQKIIWLLEKNLTLDYTSWNFRRNEQSILKHSASPHTPSKIVILRNN